MKTIRAFLSGVLLITSISVFSQQLPKSASQLPHYFETHFNAGDIEAVMKMYEPAAVFMPQPGTVTQGNGIKQATLQFMSLKLPIHIQVRNVYETNGIALLIADWTIDGKGPDGKEIHLKGSASDVVRQQPDGTWKYAIDNPFGTYDPKTATGNKM